jgi:hypothetical protein
MTSTRDDVAIWIAERLVVLAPRFPHLRGFDMTAVIGGSIIFSRGVATVPDPDYARSLAEYEEGVRAEPYRKRQPPPSPTMASYAADGISLSITFITAVDASKSAAFRSPSSRIGDVYCDVALDGPKTESFADLARAIAQILSNARDVAE